MTDSSITEPQEILAERLAKLDARLVKYIESEEKRTHWKDIGIPMLSLVVALAGVLSAAGVQVYSLAKQTELKQYEVTFIAKQKAYSEFMASMQNFAALTSSAPLDTFIELLHKVQADAYALDPFLDGYGRYALSIRFDKFRETAMVLRKKGEAGNKDTDPEFIALFAELDEVHKELLLSLFGSSK